MCAGLQSFCDTVDSDHYRRTAGELHIIRRTAKRFKTDGNVELHGRACGAGLHGFAAVSGA